jgi:hypothetical protein
MFVDDQVTQKVDPEKLIFSYTVQRFAYLWAMIIKYGRNIDLGEHAVTGLFNRDSSDTKRWILEHRLPSYGEKEDSF